MTEAPARGLRAMAAEDERQSRAQAKEDRKARIKQAAVLVVTAGRTVRGAAREVGLDDSAKSSVDREVQLLKIAGVGDVPDLVTEPHSMTEPPATVTEDEHQSANEKRRATIERQKAESAQYKVRKRGKGVGGTFEEYRHACVQAQEWRRTKNKTISEAQAFALREFGITVGRTAIQCGKAPRKVGGPTAIAWEEERRFVDVLVLLRSMNVDLDRATVMEYANALIKGTELEKKFPNGVTNDWYQRFMNDHKDKLGRW